MGAADQLAGFTPTPYQRRLMDAMKESGDRRPVFLGGRGAGRTTAMKLLICEEAATPEDADRCIEELERRGVVAMVNGRLAPEAEEKPPIVIYDEVPCLDCDEAGCEKCGGAGRRHL